MSRFVQLVITTYDRHGAPAGGGDDKLINMDQVVSIERQLSSNQARRNGLEALVDEEHYPCFELTTSTGRKFLVPIGICTDVATGIAALERFEPLLTGVSPLAGQPQVLPYATP